MFMIKDWAGNICFNGQEFEDFEDAWGFVYEFYRYLDEDEFDERMSEFEVVEK